MTVQRGRTNSYHWGSDSWAGANSLVLSEAQFIKKVADVVTKSAATELVSGVNTTTATFASDNESVDKDQVEFAPSRLEIPYDVDVVGIFLTFDADFVEDNTIDLNVNGVAMTQVDWFVNSPQTLTAIATQLTTDFPGLIATATTDVPGINIIPVTTNDSVVITDIVVAAWVSQANWSVSSQEIANTDEGSFYDLATSTSVDAFSKHATSGQVLLIKANTSTEGEFIITNT